MSKEQDQFIDPVEDPHTCKTCKGSGSVDSGGFYPWGLPIAIPCPDCEGTGKSKCEPPDTWYEND